MKGSVVNEPISGSHLVEQQNEVHKKQEMNVEFESPEMAQH
jgi:hypothetical protein